MLDALGHHVCPRVLHITSSSMVLQYLQHEPWRLQMIRARQLLETLVWRKHPPEYLVDPLWAERFESRFEMELPEWVWQEPMRMIHGDPTAANVRHFAGHVRILDPKRPGSGIPPMPSVDLGKMLQSQLGWERVLAGDLQVYDSPLEGLDDLTLRRAMFWCAIHMKRIMKRESGGTPLWTWAGQMRDALLEAVL